MIDGVHDRVQRGREGVEVFTIERRDERAVETLNRVVRQRVATMLGVPDGLDLGDVRRIGGQQLLEEQRGGLDFGRHLAVEVEELLVSRKQIETHAPGLPSRASL